MDELRMVRREDGTLILANELGEEYRFAIDSVVASEIRQLTKRPAGSSTVRPREIQALLRSGKSRLEVAVETGLEEADIERFEEPVRAEQRYMLELARLVTVRTDPARAATGDSDEQRFGEVVSERLIGLGNTNSTWRSWRDETSGWLIGLTFDSRDGEHDAIWSLDHRKRVLTPLSPDAVNLSKIGEIGDRLIPKLRAVESEQGERFDSGAFDPDALLSDTAEHDGLPLEGSPEDTALFSLGSLRSSPAPSEADIDAEYERRREIDSLAVSTTAVGAEDLSQTSDLLDALRRRRDEREQSFDLGSNPPGASFDVISGEDSDDAEVSEDTEQVPQNARPKGNETPSSAARSIWGASGVTGSEGTGSSRLRAVDLTPDSPDNPEPSAQTPGNGVSQKSQREPEAETKPQPGVKPSKRGRSSIPSWDDILFGTRSDDDPA